MDEPGHGDEGVLAVVEHEQEAGAAQPFGEVGGGCRAAVLLRCAVADPQPGGHGLRDPVERAVGACEGAQFHQPHPVGEVRFQRGGDLQREPCLAHAVRSRQTHQSPLVKERSHPPDLLRAPDQRVDRRGQVGTWAQREARIRRPYKT
ncbi:hypothetical protein [Streptomyces sp. NPDC047315]|uniref:hypothetical protein n=1 Tax=Streptomyces sp. NPDC047315 TaxID=3155142 RepID=UPI00340A9A11